jgi:hypothetical protein
LAHVPIVVVTGIGVHHRLSRRNATQHLAKGREPLRVQKRVFRVVDKQLGGAAVFSGSGKRDVAWEVGLHYGVVGDWGGPLARLVWVSRDAPLNDEVGHDCVTHAHQQQQQQHAHNTQARKVGVTIRLLALEW